MPKKGDSTTVVINVLPMRIPLLFLAHYLPINHTTRCTQAARRCVAAYISINMSSMFYQICMHIYLHNFAADL